MSSPPLRTVSVEQVESLIAFFGNRRGVFPEWYVAYLMQPWIPGFIPELTIEFDELVENAWFARPIRAKLNINPEIDLLITGSNRDGCQAFIREDQPELITLVEINNGGGLDYKETTPEQIRHSNAMHWSKFKSLVIARGPQERFPSTNRGSWLSSLARLWKKC